MKTRILAFAVALTALLSSASFAQSGHGGSCLCNGLIQSSNMWDLQLDTVAGYGNFATAASAEMDRWNKYANVFRYRQGSFQNIGFGNGKNEVVFVTPDQAQQYWGVTMSSDTYGIAPASPKYSFDDASGFNQCPIPSGMSCSSRSTEVDVLVNANFSSDWTISGTPQWDGSGPALFGATVVHEIGHSLGFHHNFDNLSVMNYTPDFAAKYIAAADTVALRAYYPSQAQNVTDLATYPFYVNGSGYQGSVIQHTSTVTPTTIAPGGAVRIDYVTLENVGATAASNVRLNFYLSADTNVTTGDYFIGAATVSSFPAGSYAQDPTAGFSFNVPASVPPGKYYVGGLITYNTSSIDSITYNNSWVMPDQLTITGSSGGGGCSAQSLALNNNRFRVSVNWTNYNDGSTGCGTPVTLTGDTGYFWFFNSANVELVVKVLDGRPINGKFWVFYGALSDVGYTITITDTQTGSTKTYTNPPHNLASRADTSAF